MNTGIDERNEKLTFNDIKSNRHSASGILKDENGNIFSIDVKGTNYDYVEKFIKYQIVKKEGKGISTMVKPLSPKERKSLKKASGGSKKSNHEKQVHKQTSWHGLSVSVQIQELQDKSSEPQKVHITIDPDIEPGESRQINFTIFGQEIANIGCTVSNGKVTCELFEFTNPIRTESTSRQKIEHLTNFKRFDVSQLRTTGKADWNFRVIGELKSSFTLSLDLTAF